MMRFLLFTGIYIMLMITAAMAGYCFTHGREVLGAINTALALVNLLSLNNLRS